MPALTGPALTAALLLVLAGAMKAVDPAMTAGALRALGVRSSKTLVRVGAAAELLLGLLAIAAGWTAVWWLVATSYVAFAAFVVVALRAGTVVGSAAASGARTRLCIRSMSWSTSPWRQRPRQPQFGPSAHRSTPSPTRRDRGRWLGG
jgi:hypothetical protein